MAELLLDKGEIVVATARTPSDLNDLKAKYSETQLLVLKLDVNNLSEIKNTFTEAKKAFGRVDVVFNNAGWAILGDVEATPEDEARKMFDTNFWSAANVSREAARFFREENKPQGGLLLTNSSQAGVATVPGFGYYSASKHGMSRHFRFAFFDSDMCETAIEGFTKALAAELDPVWNIRVSDIPYLYTYTTRTKRVMLITMITIFVQVSIIELGAFQTAAISKIKSVSYAHPAYTNPSLPGVATRTFVDGNEHLGADARKAVKRIFELSLDPKPSLHFPLGKDAVQNVTAEIKAIEQDVVKHASRSEGLDFDV